MEIFLATSVFLEGVERSTTTPIKIRQPLRVTSLVEILN
jgi:hypothetical protein